MTRGDLCSPLAAMLSARDRARHSGDGMTHGLVSDGPHEARAVVELAVAVTATADAARAAGGV